MTFSNRGAIIMKLVDRLCKESPDCGNSVADYGVAEHKDIGNNGKISIPELYNEMECIKPLFEDVMLVNPFEMTRMVVTPYKIGSAHSSCKDSCPLRDDKLGCLCKDAISTGDNRCRYIFTNKVAHLVIAKQIIIQSKVYVLIMNMKLNPSFQFGAHKDYESLECITKISSGLVLDPLTEIFNRKYLMDNIEYIIQSCNTDNRSLCLACIDIDDFKHFNDNYGHAFGDKVLRTVADMMVKATNMLEDVHNIRIGGDEFIIIAEGVNKSRFKSAMTNLCLLVENSKLKFGTEQVGIKISIGVSEMFSDKAFTYKELYAKADKQLYKAKEAGKGCVK